MKKINWIPRFSLKIGLLHLWAGSQHSDGRRIFLLLEEIAEARVQVKLHWLSDESPMFGVYLWPTLVLYFLWTHSHKVAEN